MIINESTKAHAQAILDYLLVHPEQHKQTDWVDSSNGEVTEDNFCGTTMCVAGTSVYLKEGVKALNNSGTYFEEQAQRNLGLDAIEAASLFYTMNENKALDMLNAVAQGDEEKFNHIWETVEDE